jgi:outer membrane beta-barrel protein
MPQRRSRHTQWLIVLAGVLLCSAQVLAQPKDPKKDEPPDVEMEGGGEGATGEGEPEIEMEQTEGDLSADIAATEGAQDAIKASQLQAATKPVSWSDIVTVIRKPFLKLKRTELNPMVATTLNDNMIRHYGLGAEIAYYLTDVLSVGVEGFYYVDQFREPFDLVPRQARRLPTVNKYNWATALNFHYVPVYGKFAVLDRKIVTWEVFFTAGVGVTQSEVIPRDTSFPGFTNILISPNVGASMRFFLFKWLTINLGVRDYMFIDKYEPLTRNAMENATADEAKENADSSFINNIMFQVGASFWIPPSFEYTTFR